MASLDRHVLLKKLRDVLESLKGRVAGRNKDDVEEAISMVCCPSLFLSFLLSKWLCQCLHAVCDAFNRFLSVLF